MAELVDQGGLAWDEDTARAWKGRIQRAQEAQKAYHPWWEAAVKNYAPQVSESPDRYTLAIRTNRTYTLVERKTAELFYQKPDVQVSPSPLLEQLPQGSQVAATHATILNEKLGLDGVNVKGVARQAIFDYEMFGIGWTKVGYRAYTQDVPQERPVLDEMGQPAVDPMTGQPQMTVDVVPVPVKTECFWEAFSPKQGLIPADFRSTEFDKAPWLGVRFEMPLGEAKRLWTLPEGFQPGKAQSDGDLHLEHGQAGQAGGPTTDTVSGVELWYRSILFRDDVQHPDHLTQLVLLDGLPEPVEHRDSPYQTLGPDGAMTPDSVIGYPIHPLVVRTLTDSAYVMSDVAVALPLTQELDKFREQMIRQREINLLHWVYDREKIGKDEIDQLVSAPQGGMIGLPSEAFTLPGGAIQPLPHGPYPRENFTYNDYIDNDLARTHAIDATAAGTAGDASGLTATEANLRQANVNIRLGWEQSLVGDWFLKGVTKFSTLLQRFLDSQDAAAMVGQQAAEIWDQWRQMSPTRLSFTMAPDSSLRNDTPLDRKQLQDLFTYLANDPTINRGYLTQRLLHKFHLDPTRALLPPEQVPQPKPEPPKLSLSFKGEDLNPLSPQAPIVLDLLTKAGVEISPEAIQNAMQLGQMAMLLQQPAGQDDQPPHGGKVAQMEGLSKHATDKTGGMQGTGVPNPGMSGGGGFA